MPEAPLARALDLCGTISLPLTHTTHSSPHPSPLTPHPSPVACRPTSPTLTPPTFLLPSHCSPQRQGFSFYEPGQACHLILQYRTTGQRTGPPCGSPPRKLPTPGMHKINEKPCKIFEILPRQFLLRPIVWKTLHGPSLWV